MLTTRFEDALVEAARLHRSQPRKGTTTPYISHLMAVAGLCLEHGADEDTAIAALFHEVRAGTRPGRSSLATAIGCSPSSRPAPTPTPSPSRPGQAPPHVEKEA